MIVLALLSCGMQPLWETDVSMHLQRLGEGLTL